MAGHNPAHQDGVNGPLALAIRERIDIAKNKLGLTLVQVGEYLGFSGPWMSKLLRTQDPGRVRTKHVDRIIEALEKMEINAGIRLAISGRDVETTAPSPGNANSTPDPSMPDLIRAAHKLGFEVCFRPL